MIIAGYGWHELLYARTPVRSTDFEVKDVDDPKRLHIDQDEAASDEYVSAIRRRRRQFANELHRNRLHLLLQSRWKRSARHQLSFQSRGQAITFCQPGRQVT